MTILDTAVEADLTLIEGPDGRWSAPSETQLRGEPDWRSLFERERARAERLRWSDVDARSRLGSLKWQLDACRKRLKAAVKETEEVRRTARDALSLQAEVTRLRKLLEAAGVESSKRSTMVSLRKEVGRLRKAVRALETRAVALEAQLAKLRATRAVLSKTLFGRKSEKQETPRSARRRGHQPGAAGHGRTQRPALDERMEVHNPPANERVCAGCGKAYAANGAEVSTLIEVDVAAHKRVIRRRRWRRSCGCACSPRDVSAPPAPRLFVNTPYGTSVWSRFLFERYACLRPMNRVAAWLCDQGLAISPGTLGDSVHRFVPLFEPLAEAILEHQNEAAVRHGDETGWRIQSLRETGRSSRAWLWTSVSQDAVYFHIDPSRSAEAAAKLFGEAAPDTVLVCDRYSAYKKLARELAGAVVLQWCWAHLRRDFIEGAAGQVELTPWCQGWLERIASIYRLNEARLAHYDPGRERQTAAFDTAQGTLKEALDGLFAVAERELAALSEQAREGKALRSLVNHRDGLSVFVDRPLVHIDNNFAERALRGPVIGRRLSFGSDSETGARFTAQMYSVVGTLALNDIDVRHWLQAWLEACAANGGRAPPDRSEWLPWSMNEARKRTLMTPR